MVAVDIDLDPVAGKTVTAVHAAHDRVGRRIVAAIRYVEKFFVVEDLEAGGLGGSVAFMGLPLGEFAAPRHSIPGCFIGHPVQGDSTCKTLGIILFANDGGIALDVLGGSEESTGYTYECKQGCFDHGSMLLGVPQAR